MPRSFLIKKKEKLPRWDRYEPEDVTPIVTPRTVYTPTPSRLEQLAAIVTGSPIHYLPTYPVSPFTPLAVSLANGKWPCTHCSWLFFRRLKTNLRFVICNPGFTGYLWVMCNMVIQILLSLEVLTSRHLIQINHLHICERSCLGDLSVPLGPISSQLWSCLIIFLSSAVNVLLWLTPVLDSHTSVIFLLGSWNSEAEWFFFQIQS